MSVVAEYKVARPLKWMGEKYERGDTISRDRILANENVGEARLGSLQRTGFIVPANRPLAKMTKAELVDYGREVGAEVDPNMVKADLVAEIEGVL